jgi:hypothetical protein
MTSPILHLRAAAIESAAYALHAATRGSGCCHAGLLHNTVICPKQCPCSKLDCDYSCLHLCGQEFQRPFGAPIANMYLPCGYVCISLAPTKHTS